MKVIKQGTKPQEKIWIGTCDKCGSIVEAKQEELTKIERGQRDGDYGYGTCPVCCDPKMVFYEKD